MTTRKEDGDFCKVDIKGRWSFGGGATKKEGLFVNERYLQNRDKKRKKVGGKGEEVRIGSHREHRGSKEL